MNDEKLDELIEEYGENCFKYGECCEASSHCDGYNEECVLTKKAIVDYVEGKRKEMIDAPEKIYLADLTEFKRTDKTVLSLFSKEYIRKDIQQEALTPIREVWERFKNDKYGGLKHCNTHGNTLYWLDKALYAIKKALGEK